MGGYGAIKFGLKYSDMFSLVGSFSGAFDATRRTEKTGNKYPSIPIVYGPEGSKTRADNDIFALVSSVPVDKMPFIYFDCGTEDPFVTINREFAALLAEKKVPHEFRELPGKHEWPYWDQQVQEFLRIAGRKLGAGITKN
jgi:putative lysine transport system ATP-binding protein